MRFHLADLKVDRYFGEPQVVGAAVAECGEDSVFGKVQFSAPISFRVADEAVAVVMLQRLWVYGEHDEPAHVGGARRLKRRTQLISDLFFRDTVSLQPKLGIYPGSTCGHEVEPCSHRFASDSTVSDSLEAE